MDMQTQLLNKVLLKGAKWATQTGGLNN
jgi:hypothetical protein